MRETVEEKKLYILEYFLFKKLLNYWGEIG